MSLPFLHSEQGSERTHGGKVLILSPDPEGPVGAPVSENHALGNRVTVDESFVTLLLKARWVPALLHHLDGHLCHSKLVSVGHLGRLKGGGILGSEPGSLLELLHSELPLPGL